MAVATVGVAFACGPNFPWQLFDDRDAAVAEPVGLGFAFEAARLVPAPRDGYVWDQGRWRWDHGRYVWVPGHWQPVRVGYHWVPGHWAQHGPHWRWIEGHWA